MIIKGELYILFEFQNSKLYLNFDYVGQIKVVHLPHDSIFQSQSFAFPHADNYFYAVMYILVLRLICCIC